MAFKNKCQIHIEFGRFFALAIAVAAAAIVIVVCTLWYIYTHISLRLSTTSDLFFILFIFHKFLMRLNKLNESHFGCVFVRENWRANTKNIISSNESFAHTNLWNECVPINKKIWNLIWMKCALIEKKNAGERREKSREHTFWMRTKYRNYYLLHIRIVCKKNYC